MAYAQRLIAVALALACGACSTSRLDDGGVDVGLFDAGRDDRPESGPPFDAGLDADLDAGDAAALPDAASPPCGALGARLPPLDVTAHVPSTPDSIAVAPDATLTWLERTTEWVTVTAAPGLTNLAAARAPFIPISVTGAPVPGPYFLTGFDVADDSWLVTFGTDAADAQADLAVVGRDGVLRGPATAPLPPINSGFDIRGVFGASDGAVFHALAVERSISASCAQRVREVLVPFDGSAPMVGPAVDMEIIGYPQWSAGTWLFLAPTGCSPGATLQLWTLPSGAASASVVSTDLPSAIFYLWAPAGDERIAVVLGATDTDPPHVLDATWLDRATATIASSLQEVFRSSSGFVQGQGTIVIADGAAAVILRVDERVADPPSESEWLLRAAAGGSAAPIRLSGPQPPISVTGRVLLLDGREAITDWSEGSRHLLGGALCTHVP